MPKKKKKKPVKRTQVNLTEPSGAGLGGGMIRVDIDFLEEALQERMIDSAENIGGWWFDFVDLWESIRTRTGSAQH